MPEGLMVDKETLYDFNSRRLEEKGYAHERNRSGIRGYNLHIFLGMIAHNPVQAETINDFLT
jgi:hypothetical protein